jgi:hypothetical protein
MKFAFTLVNVGDSVLFPGGDNIAILSSSQSVTLDFLDANGGTIDRAENVPASFFYRKSESESRRIMTVKVTASTAAAVGEILVTNGDSGVSVISGVVEVVDGSKQIVKNGMAFAGFVSSYGTATEYAHAELKNVSADKNMVLSKIVLQQRQNASPTSTDALVWLVGFTAALPTVAGSIFSKKIGGALVSGPQGYKKVATALEAVNREYAVARISVSDRYELELVEPFILPPGERIGAKCDEVGRSLVMSFHGYMEP